MTEDAMLRDILLDAAADEFAAELNDTTSIDASPRLRRQMTAMLSDPQGWVKRKRRPVWKRIARAAAVIVLTCALSLGALMAVSPAVRAGIINWAIEWYDTQIVYRFSGAQADDPGAYLPKYEVTMMPEGYEPYGEYIIPGSCDFGYVNDDGELLWFGYQRMTQGSALAIQEDTEGMTVYEVTVNGCKGKVYCPRDTDPNNIIVWIDEKNNLEFDISGFFGKDELLTMAQSVTQTGGGEIALPKYEITAMPEGYALLEESHAAEHSERYRNDDGDYLWFEYQPMMQGAAMSVSTEDVVVSEVKVNGCPGQLFHSLDKDMSSAIVWIDEKSDLKFLLDGFFSDQELLRMAESVKMVDAAH